MVILYTVNGILYLSSVWVKKQIHKCVEGTGCTTSTGTEIILSPIDSHIEPIADDR